MMAKNQRRLGALSPLLVAAAISALLTAACGGDQQEASPVATPSLTLSHDRAPAGSPLELTYRFVVASDVTFDRDYRVMAHVVDIDQEQMWTDDHDPPVPTSQWKAGQTIEYTRTIFVPVYPYIGEASIDVGLYSTETQQRLPMTGEHVGQNAYRVARFHLFPQTDNLLTVFKDGWHPAEVAADNATIEWQWTKKEATLAFRNPKKDSKFYLEADSPGGAYHGPQTVQVVIGNDVIDEFTLESDQRVLRTPTMTAAQLGSEEMAEIQIRVSSTFIPAQLPAANNKDPRELGIRVFHAFVDPR
jgi:hypothetical protein